MHMCGRAEAGGSYVLKAHPPSLRQSILLESICPPDRAVLKGKKKSVPLHSFPQKALGHSMFNHGWWRLAVGGWRRLAIGSWQLVVGGGWWLVIGGWWRLVVVGDWRQLVALGGWQLVGVGGWPLVVPWGGP